VESPLEYSLKVQAKILEEQLNICKNEAENLISVAAFFLGEKIRFDDKEDELKSSVEQRFREKRIDPSIWEEKGKEVLNILRKKNRRRKAEKGEFVLLISSLESLKTKLSFFSLFLEKLRDEIPYGRLYLPTEVLIFYSILFEEIGNVLKALNVAAKVLKFRRENAYQSYVPIPLLHRRYRLYNLHHFLNSQFKKLFSSTTSDGIEFLFSSDYDVGDIVTAKFPVVLVRGSFFWREQVSLLPLLAHEIAHGLYYYYYNDDKVKKVRRELQKITEEYSLPSIVSLSFREIQTLWEDVFADAVAYFSLGDAYFLSLLFGGLFGYKYSILPTEENSVAFSPTSLVPVNGISDIERAIIRICVLNLLRNRRKGLTNENEKDEIKEVIDGVFEALGDLFPLSNCKREGKAYSFLTMDKRATFCLKTSLIEGLANRFSRLVEVLEIERLSINENSIRISWKEENGSLTFPLGGRFYKLYEDSDGEFRISVKKEEKENSSFRNSNVYEVIWKFNLKRLKERYGFTLWEGRIFRTFYVAKHPFFGTLLDVCRDELVLDEFIQIKTREIYEKCRGSILDEILNFRLGEFRPFYSLGVFDFSFFRREMEKGLKSAKEDERDFYKRLLDTLSYADRHSIWALKKRADELTTKQNSKSWRGVVLAKVSLDRLREKPEEGIEEDLKNLKKYLYGISSGWESLIFVVEGKLADIFGLKKELSLKSWIERTETVINVHPDFLKSGKGEENSKYLFSIHASARLGKLSYSNFPTGWKLYPGRHDVLYFKRGLNEKEVLEELRNILSNQDLKEARVKDLHIDILSGFYML